MDLLSDVSSMHGSENGLALWDIAPRFEALLAFGYMFTMAGLFSLFSCGSEPEEGWLSLEGDSLAFTLMTEAAEDRPVEGVPL